MRRILFTVLATAAMLSANAANPAEGVLKVKGMTRYWFTLLNLDKGPTFKTPSC